MVDVIGWLWLEPRFSLKVDRTACIGVGNRQGVGKARHLDTRRLWLEARVQCGQAALGKCTTEGSIADIGNRPVNGVRLQLLSLAAGQWTQDDDEATTDDVYDVYSDEQRNPKAVDDEHVGRSSRRWPVLCAGEA